MEILARPAFEVQVMIVNRENRDGTTFDTETIEQLQEAERQGVRDENIEATRNQIYKGMGIEKPNRVR